MPSAALAIRGKSNDILYIVLQDTHKQIQSPRYPIMLTAVPLAEYRAQREGEHGSATFFLLLVT